MPPVTITAQGTSTIFRQAERAVVTVHVSSEGTSQEKVSEEVTLTANELRSMLKGLSPKTENGMSLPLVNPRDTSREISLRRDVGEAKPDAPVTYWKNSTLSTSSYQPTDDKGKKLDRLFFARTGFEIKVRDFERLGSLATTLSTMPLVSISQVEWRLTEATKASLASESRRGAVKDAVVKAGDYAAVLGRGKPEAVEVSDGNSNFGSYAQGFHSRVAAHGGGHGRGHGHGQQWGEILNFDPESVRLNTTVTVKFLAE
jgi:hypothetical protein